MGLHHVHEESGPTLKGFRFRAIKNAVANLIRGGATAMVAIALPHFFTRLLDKEHFAAWSLILQIAAYASYLDFGLQTAIARFIAQAIELEHKERQEKLISTALILLSAAALIAFAVISIVISQFPRLFDGVPSGLLPEFRHAALLLSLIACLLLPLSTYSGVLIGMHRNEIPALAIGGSRIAGCVLAILVGHCTQSLPWLVLCLGGPNVFGGLLQLVAVHGLLAEGKARLRHVSRIIGVELLRFSAGLTVWSFGMLLVSGLDVTIVGHFRFSAVGSYSIASMLISFFAGLTNAALGALMAPLAALHARDETRRILRVVFAATQTTLLANLLLIAAVFLFGEPGLRFWVGRVYAESALPILKVLAVAQTVRLTVAPYTVMLVSVGDPKKAVPAAICEALVNLTARSSLRSIGRAGPPTISSSSRPARRPARARPRLQAVPAQVGATAISRGRSERGATGPSALKPGMVSTPNGTTLTVVRGTPRPARSDTSSALVAITASALQATALAGPFGTRLGLGASPARPGRAVLPDAVAALGGAQRVERLHDREAPVTGTGQRGQAAGPADRVHDVRLVPVPGVRQAERERPDVAAAPRRPALRRAGHVLDPHSAGQLVLVRQVPPRSSRA